MLSCSCRRTIDCFSLTSCTSSCMSASVTFCLFFCLSRKIRSSFSFSWTILKVKRNLTLDPAIKIIYSFSWCKSVLLSPPIFWRKLQPFPKCTFFNKFRDLLRFTKKLTILNPKNLPLPLLSPKFLARLMQDQISIFKAWWNLKNKQTNCNDLLKTKLQ